MTDEQKLIVKAYMSEICNDEKEAIEFAKNESDNITIYNNTTYKDIVREMILDGAITAETLINYIDYDSIIQDLKCDYTAVYEDGNDVVIFY